MTRSRSVLLPLACTLLAALAVVPPAGASPMVVAFRVDAAVAFLKSQQQPDGGFETAGFPGFETPDAVLALAEAAQTGPSWSRAAALAAVRGTVRNGRTPLDYLDDLAETTASPGQAAKLIVLVAAPLGLDPAAFNPQGDAPADLVAKMDAGRNPNGSYGPAAAFNATLYAALANAVLGRGVAADTRDYVLRAQQANGGWSFAGNPAGTGDDVDTTGLALQVLRAAGVDRHSDPVRRAVAFLARLQLPSAGWAASGAEDPNSTAVAILGLTAAGHDVSSACWTLEAGGDPHDALARRQAPDGHVAGPGDQFGVNTFATSQAVQAVLRRWLPVARAPAYCPDHGYRLVASDGGVFAFGTARFLGSMGAVRLNQPVVGMAATPTGQGYWLVASDGGVFSFGDARFFGSTGNIRLNQPVVGMAATPTGQGYWLVASDGGVFSFGDARFFGSTGNIRLNQPVVGMAAAPTGQGYWAVARDGGVFAFGDARFFGSTGAIRLNRPVVGMAATPTGQGYWMVASDSGVFAFGDAGFFGSDAASRTVGDVVGLRPGFRGRGYLYATSDGRAVQKPPVPGVPPGPGLGRLKAPVVGVSS